MKILEFTLSGRHAIFKKPEVNAICLYTYGQIHKPALLGIFGAILGYAGYNEMKKADVFPEYYHRLHHTKVSITPNAEKGYFSRKISCFNNSVGYASREQGGNLIVKEQWLEDPSWNIYVQLNHEEAEKLADAVMRSVCVYVPYLGKNDHPADITNAVVKEGAICESASSLDCLFPKHVARIDQDADLFGGVENPFKYEEALPISLDEETNQYRMERFVYTNMQLSDIAGDIWSVNGKRLTFY